MIELGQITLVDVVLVGVTIFFGCGGGFLVFKKVTSSRNTLKGNKAGGDMAGGDIIRKGQKNEKNSKKRSKNILKNNTAGGDIAGGDIEK